MLRMQQEKEPNKNLSPDWSNQSWERSKLNTTNRMYAKMDAGDFPISIKVVKVDQTRRVALQEISKKRRELGEHIGTKCSRKKKMQRP